MRFLLLPQVYQTHARIIHTVVQRGRNFSIKSIFTVCHYFIIQNVFQTEKWLTYIRKTAVGNTIAQKPDVPEK